MPKSAVVLLTLCALATTAAFLPPTAVIYVDDDAGLVQNGSSLFPFAEIQAAIDAADEGTTIRIAVGDYQFFSLYKRLHLQGAGIDNVRVYQDEGEPSFVSSADGVVIEGISFLGPGDAAEPAGLGLLIEDCTNLLILSVKFPFFATGLRLERSEATVSASIFEFGEIGIYLSAESILHASANLIVNNEIGIDCAGGRVESCDDLIEGNQTGVSEACLPLDF